ncbi:MAG: exo-beta-N-acetylmuramidase NamZ family protein, partial [Crocinitomicaceae bacterium]
GKNKKPSDEQLKGLDVLVFDIQDVGVRFYTYISTLHYVMEACAENDVALIVLDRPNPNGHYIDGPILEKAQKSFVGMHPIPIVHGMTIAEYAKMINGEKWLENGVTCDLTVVSCDNYNHNKTYSLPVPPSPNLRSDVSIQLYPSLCLLEATTVTVGRGTDGPFERYGHPNFPKTAFSFTPKSGPGSKNPKHKNVLCHGYNLNDSTYTRMHQLDLSFVLNANKQLNGKLFVDREKFFNLLAGNSTLLKQVESGMTEDEIRATWKAGLDQFNVIRSKYLMYE